MKGFLLSGLASCAPLPPFAPSPGTSSAGISLPGLFVGTPTPPWASVAPWLAAPLGGTLGAVSRAAELAAAAAPGASCTEKPLGGSAALGAPEGGPDTGTGIGAGTPPGPHQVGPTALWMLAAPPGATLLSTAPDGSLPSPPLVGPGATAAFPSELWLSDMAAAAFSA